MRKLKQKIILLCVLVLGIISFFILKPSNKVIKNDPSPSEETSGMISVLVDGVEQSAFPSKGSAEYQSTSCTNGETAVWDATNWKLSIQDISASTRCVVSFVTGGHNVYVSVSGGTVDSAPKNVAHNGNVTFTVAASNANYVFSSAKCTGANGYSWANNVLSVNGVVSDAYCDVVFSRPTYTVYFTVVGGFSEDNYLTVVRGGGNSTTFGAIAGYLTSGATITCDSGITGKLAGTRVVISNVLASGDCTITNSRDTSNYLPGGATYNVGDEVSYANLAWLVVGSDSETVTLILKANATYDNESGSNTTGTGVYGSGVTFTSSSARSYLQDIWLEQTQQKYLKSAIDSNALAYQDDANGYVRLPYMREVNQKLPNASGTNFWTMDNDGNGHVYYGQPNGYGNEGKSSDGKWYFIHYTLATNTSVNYSWSSTIKGTYSSTISGYYSTTCFARNQESGTASTSDGCDTHNDDYATYCSSSGAKSVKLCTSYSGKYWYVSCAGQVTISGYTPSTYCTTSCSNRSSVAVKATATSNETATCSVTINPYSGNAYNSGQYSAGYKKWVANVGTEVQDTTATNHTAYTYNNTTDGNNDMTTAVQAVAPTSSSARTNDTAPTNTGNQTITATTHTALSNASFTAARISNAYYQGYTTSASVDSSCNNLKPKISSGSIAANAGTCVTGSKTYMRYTLNPYNSSTMGYRPVIVVYKAN